MQEDLHEKKVETDEGSAKVGDKTSENGRLDSGIQVDKGVG